MAEECARLGSVHKPLRVGFAVDWATISTREARISASVIFSGHVITWPLIAGSVLTPTEVNRI